MSGIRDLSFCFLKEDYRGYSEIEPSADIADIVDFHDHAGGGELPRYRDFVARNSQFQYWSKASPDLFKVLWFRRPGFSG